MVGCGLCRCVAVYPRLCFRSADRHACRNLRRGGRHLSVLRCKTRLATCFSGIALTLGQTVLVIGDWIQLERRYRGAGNRE